VFLNPDPKNISYLNKINLKIWNRTKTRLGFMMTLLMILIWTRAHDPKSVLHVPIHQFCGSGSGGKVNNNGSGFRFGSLLLKKRIKEILEKKSIF
jgi:hypothetical protein